MTDQTVNVPQPVMTPERKEAFCRDAAFAAWQAEALKWGLIEQTINEIGELPSSAEEAFINGCRMVLSCLRE
jgi:hypothetical protein